VLDNQHPRIARTVAQEALRKLEAAGVVGKVGKGKKGVPHRWFRTGELSAGTQIT
jgi:GTP-sensing pleiotropic transcriptional regulator CodY